MTYTQIIDKIKRVFESCVLYSQIYMAYDYCSRLNARYNISWGKDPTCFWGKDGVSFRLTKNTINKLYKLACKRLSDIEDKG